MEKVKLAIQATIGLGLLGYLGYLIGTSGITRLLRDLNILWFCISVLVFFIVVCIGTFALKTLFDGIKKTSWKQWVRAYLSTFAVSQFVPGKIGEFSIAYFLRRENISIGESAAVSVIDKMVTLVALILLAIVGIKWFVVSSIWPSVVASVVLIAGGTFVLTPQGTEIAFKYLGKHKEKLEGFRQASEKMINSEKQRIFVNFILTIVRFVASGLLLVVIFLAIDVYVPVIPSILISAIMTIVSIIPLTPNGVGLRESSGVLLYQEIGVAPEAAAFALLLNLFFMYLLSGVVLLLFVKNKMSIILRGA